jgi:hypothetical protein
VWLTRVLPRNPFFKGGGNFSVQHGFSTGSARPSTGLYSFFLVQRLREKRVRCHAWSELDRGKSCEKELRSLPSKVVKSRKTVTGRKFCEFDVL